MPTRRRQLLRLDAGDPRWADLVAEWNAVNPSGTPVRRNAHRGKCHGHTAGPARMVGSIGMVPCEISLGGTWTRMTQVSGDQWLDEVSACEDPSPVAEFDARHAAKLAERAG